MKLKLKERITALLSSENVDVKDLVTLAVESELADGTVIATDADAWADGVKAWVIQDGEQMAAPDGEHTLTDGMILTVENGVVTSVMTAEEMATDKERIQNLEKQVAEFKETLTELNTAYEALNAEKLEAEQKAEELEKEVKESTSKVEELSKQKAAVSLNKQPKEKVNIPKPGRNAKLRDRVLYHTHN